MKGDEMELIAQPLLESRTGAYIERLDNKSIMTANNNINKDSLLVLRSTKRNLANHKAYHILWSREIIRTSRISLASTLCTQGYLPLLQVTLEEYLVWRILLVGSDEILVILSLDVIFQYSAVYHSALCIWYCNNALFKKL